MIAALINHLWQSTLFVVAAGVVAFALRKNSAAVRHRIWLTASVKFLVPFSLLIGLGSALAPAATIPAATSDIAPFSVAVDRIAQPFGDESLSAAAFVSAEREHASTDWTPVVLAATWLCGFTAVVFVRMRDWRRIRAIVRTSSPAPIATSIPTRSSLSLFEPGVVGIRRPMLLLPAGIEQQLTRAQLDAVLAHELCHVQRRDNLTSALHMAVEAVFWFHPLVWVVGAKLIDERERACDEHVLRVCGEPHTYAESILNVVKLYVESPVACVSGVSGADLKKRVAAIMVNRIGLRLNATRKIALAIAGVLAVALPLAAGVVAAPVRAVSAVQRQAGSAGYPAFDVVSVKPCASNAPGQARGRVGEAGSGTPITSPDTLYLQCYPISTMVSEAYVFFAEGRGHALTAGLTVGIEGGAEWTALKADRYTIEAKAGQATPAAVMRGPMLQAVLENRFKLKLHRETREMPVYEMVAAKSGAKVSPYTGNDCVLRDSSVWPPVALPAGQRYCGDQTHVEGDRIVRVGVQTLDELAGLMGGLDRPVVNKTGITAPVSYRFEYLREPSPDSLVAALKDQMGLELKPAKGPREFLVIDHLERAVSDDAIQSTPKFDVVSVRPCDQNAQSPGRGSTTGATSPGRLRLDCQSLFALINTAYVSFANGRVSSPGDRPDFRPGLTPAPDWMLKERFTIEAKADGDPPPSILRGPMLQAILEDRFKLKVHIETRVVPVDELVIAKGGPKLTPFKPGTCVPYDLTAYPQPPLAPGERRCQNGTASSDEANGSWVDTAEGTTLDAWVANMMVHSDDAVPRPIINKTGLSGLFTFRVVHQRSESSTAAPMETALKDQLGLELKPAKGPRKFLVVDHVERPTPNDPLASPMTRGAR